MAYTLKSSGLALKLASCFAVDEDGTTIKDFCSSSVTADMTINGGVTRGSKSWKGTSRYYFHVGNGNDAYNIAFGTNKPPIHFDDGTGGSVFVACAGAGTTDSVGAVIYGNSANAIYSISASSDRQHDLVSGTIGTASVPKNDTSFSLGWGIIGSGAVKLLYGLEASADMSSDGTGTYGVGYGIGTFGYIGSVPGQGRQPAKYHIVATFTESLSDGEFQSLHDDWFGVLFESAAAAPVLTSPTVTSIASTTATVGCTTDSAAGTLHCSVTTSATQPTVQQIKDGQDHTGAAAISPTDLTISSTGAKTFNITGMTSGLTYYAHFVHNNSGDSNRLSTGAIYPGTFRTVSDVTVTGWSVTGAATHAAARNENSASDSEYSTSPALSASASSIVTQLDRTLPAGAYTIKYRCKLSSGTGTVKLTLMNDSNVSQGASADTAINATFTTRDISVTTTGNATRIKEEIWI